MIRPECFVSSAGNGILLGLGKKGPPSSTGSFEKSRDEESNEEGHDSRSHKTQSGSVPTCYLSGQDTGWRSPTCRYLLGPANGVSALMITLVSHTKFSHVNIP